METLKNGEEEEGIEHEAGVEQGGAVKMDTGTATKELAETLKDSDEISNTLRRPVGNIRVRETVGRKKQRINNWRRCK